MHPSHFSPCGGHWGPLATMGALHPLWQDFGAYWSLLPLWGSYGSCGRPLDPTWGHRPLQGASGPSLISWILMICDSLLVCQISAL